MLAETHCPICSTDISDAENCHAGCPMSTSCALIRCPNCGYEYPDPSRSLVAGWLSKLLRRQPSPEDHK